MTLLQAYLNKPSTRRVLNRKAGEQGFSLIELVVVIAVLAVLIVIALPNFQGVTDDAAVSSGKKYLVDGYTECNIARTRGLATGASGGPSITPPTINGGTFSTTSAIPCPIAAGTTLTYTPALTSIPTFTIDLYSGAKTCVVAGRGTGYNCNATTLKW
ncbi:prepilin-type N-terminal cleavage/methylation domain protein [Synechococcus sp. PROS-7-1]|uniref:prepilin-type N-terminal cleavage/methylation domain-containing protein n=1 Tax=Synechococcus sp. PROS-7-1 TaxID=1442556 RepID=UPI00164894A4|nr:prepilin-type N-terminal cleavage/methylation domain-containing protein [Synechococcus sp. PROS-7-1]QNI86423.1 prepilin-type N-terminal cleavage/methylation domain protein [Synechococcus sp. PROS-7-1]